MKWLMRKGSVSISENRLLKVHATFRVLIYLCFITVRIQNNYGTENFLPIIDCKARLRFLLVPTQEKVLNKRWLVGSEKLTWCHSYQYTQRRLLCSSKWMVLLGCCSSSSIESPSFVACEVSGSLVPDKQPLNFHRKLMLASSVWRLHERHWYGRPEGIHYIYMTCSANWKNNRAKAERTVVQHSGGPQCWFYMGRDFCAYSRAYGSVQNNLLSNYAVRSARTSAKILPRPQSTTHMRHKRWNLVKSDYKMQLCC